MPLASLLHRSGIEVQTGGVTVTAGGVAVNGGVLSVADGTNLNGYKVEDGLSNDSVAALEWITFNYELARWAYSKDIVQQLVETTGPNFRVSGTSVTLDSITGCW